MGKRGELEEEMLSSHDINLEVLYSYKRKIKEILASDMSNKEKLLNDILTEMYINGKKAQVTYQDMDLRYEYIDTILELEDLLGDYYILNTKSNFGKAKNLCDSMLDYIVYKVRGRLLSSQTIFSSKVKFDRLDLSNLCRVSSFIVNDITSKIGIENRQVVIHPGFSKECALYDGNGYHFFNIVTGDGKSYIVDCAYKQFFLMRRNNLERVGIVGLSGCSLGVFMAMDEERLMLAKQLIEKGYVELTEKNWKLYLDGFAISYRNGLWYEAYNDFTYTTFYTVDDYIRFLRGEDNQVAHEGRGNLGWQSRPNKKLLLLTDR